MALPKPKPKARKRKRPIAELTKPQRKILDRGQDGELIRIEHKASHEGEFFFTNGTVLDGRVVKALIRKGYFIAVGDALLPGDTQSYQALGRGMKPGETRPVDNPALTPRLTGKDNPP